MKCKMTKKIQDYLDKTLSIKENSYFAEHLKICPYCKKEFAVMEEIFAELEKLKETAFVLSEDITPEVLEKIHQVNPFSKFYLNSKYFIMGLLLFFYILFISIFHQEILSIIIFKMPSFVITIFFLFGILGKIFLNSFVYISKIIMSNIQENFLLYFTLEISAFFFTFIFAKVLIKKEIKI